MKQQIFDYLISLGFIPSLVEEHRNRLDTPEHFHMRHKNESIDVQGRFEEPDEYANFYCELRLIGRKHIEDIVNIDYTKWEEGLDDEFKSFEEVKKEFEQIFRNWDIKIESTYKMKEIIFIRHAESIANAGGRTTDIASITLSERGIQQAINLAESFTMTPELVVVSPYIRTQLTAAPLIRKQDIQNIQIWEEVKEFTYLDKVKYFNTTAEERSVAAVEFWNRCDPDWRDAEEETFNDLLNRVKLTLQKLEACPENKIVVFSHGQFLLALRMHLIYGNTHDSKYIMSIFEDEFSNFPIFNTQQFTLADLMDTGVHTGPEHLMSKEDKEFFEKLKNKQHH